MGDTRQRLDTVELEKPPFGPSVSADEPYAVYSERLVLRKQVQAEQEQRSARLANARLAWVALGLVVAIVLGFRGQWPAVGIVSGAVVFGFVLLVAYHSRIDRAARHAARAVAFYERGLDRLRGAWRGRGAQGKRFIDPDHPYALDLDVFGPASLFELICAARTMSGENALAGWLLTAPPARTTRSRQKAVQELAPRINLREQLALLGDDVEAGLDPHRLLRWAERPRIPFPGWLVPVAVSMSSVTAATLVAWLAGFTPATPFLLASLVQGGLALALRPRTESSIRAAEESLTDLRLFEQVLARLEGESFEADALARLQADLTSQGVPASEQVHRLRTWVERLETRRNQWFAPIAALMLWGTHCARVIEAWRDGSAEHLPAWLDALGQLEAFSSLAGYAYENPAHTFPHVLGPDSQSSQSQSPQSQSPQSQSFESQHPESVNPDSGHAGPQLLGRGLGHPLLDGDACVRNSIELGRCQLLLVSGSNMSGKSTLMRTVGTNAVLAYAGAPVRAEELVISELSIGATIRVQDSLQDGKSRFFAEIVRIRQLVDLARGERPLLFLIDEMFGGTNSHDRRVGAEGVLKALVELGAIGLVTSHDLALTRIADELGERAANVHFQDELVRGEIHFDFRLRPGVVTKSNALELMRSIGLDV